MDPGIRREWTAVEERWAKVKRDPVTERWIGLLNAGVPRSMKWAVAVTACMGIGGPLCVTIVEPSCPENGANLVTSEVVPSCPKWVPMRPAHNDWRTVALTIRHPTGEAYTATDEVISFEISWVAE
jgi:hypothetical protein